MASTLAEYEEGEPLASPAPSHAHSHSYSDERAYDSIKDRDGDRDALARAGDITRSALAAVASSRRSPVGTRRTRGALPKEFREGSAGDGVSAANTNGRRGSWDAQNGGGTGRGGRVSLFVHAFQRLLHLDPIILTIHSALFTHKARTKD